MSVSFAPNPLPVIPPSSLFSPHPASRPRPRGTTRSLLDGVVPFWQSAYTALDEWLPFLFSLSCIDVHPSLCSLSTPPSCMACKRQKEPMEASLCPVYIAFVSLIASFAPLFPYSCFVDPFLVLTFPIGFFSLCEHSARRSWLYVVSEGFWASCR